MQRRAQTCASHGGPSSCRSPVPGEAMPCTLQRHEEASGAWRVRRLGPVRAAGMHAGWSPCACAYRAVKEDDARDEVALSEQHAVDTAARVPRHRDPALKRGIDAGCKVSKHRRMQRSSNEGCNGREQA